MEQFRSGIQAEDYMREKESSDSVLLRFRLSVHWEVGFVHLRSLRMGLMPTTKRKYGKKKKPSHLVILTFGFFVEVAFCALEIFEHDAYTDI